MALQQHSKVSYQYLTWSYHRLINSIVKLQITNNLLFPAVEVASGGYLPSGKVKGKYPFVATSTEGSND